IEWKAVVEVVFAHLQYLWTFVSLCRPFRWRRREHNNTVARCLKSADRAERQQCPLASFCVIDNWSGVIATQLDVRGGQFPGRGFPRAMNPLVGKLGQFRHPTADVCSLWIVLLSLR